MNKESLPCWSYLVFWWQLLKCFSDYWSRMTVPVPSLCLIFLPKWSNHGRLTAAASETFCTSALTTSLGLSKLSRALLLIFSFTLVVSHFVAEGGCVCSLTCSTKLSNSSSLTEARHSPFLLKFAFPWSYSICKAFLNEYIYPSFNNFLAPSSVVVISILLYRT